MRLYSNVQKKTSHRMSLKPKLEIKQTDDEGKYCWGIYRSDRCSPIIVDISREHAEHVRKHLNSLEELPETLLPAKDWYNFDEIVEVDENGFGIEPE